MNKNSPLNQRYICPIGADGIHPEVLEQPVPVFWMPRTLNVGLLLMAYLVVLLGTFIETGAGLVDV